MSDKIVVYDNGGKSFDRYTIINTETGDMWGASFNPYHPQGFGQYVGNFADNYWVTAYGSGWRYKPGSNFKIPEPKTRIKKLIRYAKEHFLAVAENDKNFIGEKVSDLKTLPDDVQKYIEQISSMD